MQKIACASVSFRQPRRVRHEGERLARAISARALRDLTDADDNGKTIVHARSGDLISREAELGKQTRS
jgi:hypothetical protein